MEATQQAIQRAIGPATRIDGAVLCYSRDDFGVVDEPPTAMRKRASWVQPCEQPGGVLPTLEGSVDATGGLLCASVGEPGELVDPFVLTGGLDALGRVYEPVDRRALTDPAGPEFAEWRAANPDRVMDADRVHGADGVSPEVGAALLARPYVKMYPTVRHVWEAEWTDLCGEVQVRLDWSWRPTVLGPSIVARIPGTDDIYFVARDRFAKDGWARVD